MKFSVIVPSFNQDRFIKNTLDNLREIKTLARKHGAELEVLVFDAGSRVEVQNILEANKDFIDYLEVKKDHGQFDAINKGLLKCKGEYWTWLNTDDLLDKDGFIKVIEILREKADIDYIYGSVSYIDDKGNFQRTVKTWDIHLDLLVKKEASVFQPGSWFKKSFTDSVGLLSSYTCCFDYEYICRILKHKAKFYRCDFVVSKFRYYPDSKSGSIVRQFVEEQLAISAEYGRKWYHVLSWMLYLRLLKHRLLSFQ